LEILNDRLNPAATALALLTVVLWGINGVCMKITLNALPPMLTAGARFSLGLLAISLWVRLRHIPLGLGTGEAKKLLYLALLFVAQIYLLFRGTSLTLASRSIILISTYPFFTAVFAHYLIGGDRLSVLKIIGMALAFCGVALIFAENITLGSLDTLAGDAMVLTSALMLGIRQVYTKKLTRGIPPVKLLFWQALMALPILFTLSAGLESHATLELNPAVVVSLLYQGLVVAGFCFIVWTTLLRRHSASRLTVFAFFTPVSGVVASNLVLSEPVSAALLASVLVIALGIILVNHQSRPRSPLPAVRKGKKKAFRKHASGKPG
jgi:drug/metabolite transporter (DMT)-like permease